MRRHAIGNSCIASQRREQIVPAERFQEHRADRKLVEAALDHIASVGSHRSSLGTSPFDFG